MDDTLTLSSVDEKKERIVMVRISRKKRRLTHTNLSSLMSTNRASWNALISASEIQYTCSGGYVLCKQAECIMVCIISMRQFILVLYVYGRNQDWTDAKVLTFTSSRVFPRMDGSKK